jgi:rSAM/selenodomain-associated transferase 2
MISIIIPTLNEADIIASSLRDLLQRDGDFEVIVADGGSCDATACVVGRFAAVRLVTCSKGRGRQMNAGACVARGDILLFLHADTYLPPAALPMVAGALKDHGVVGGSFCLAFDHHHPLLKLYSQMSRINNLLFTYGDQGLFLRTDTFNALGGFRNAPFMEDVEILLSLRRLGRFVKFGRPVITSARRFLKYGIIRQQLRNMALVSLFHMGVPASVLKRYYPECGAGDQRRG